MLEIFQTDTGYLNSPEAGEPSCICSRCMRTITENELPLRLMGLRHTTDGCCYSRGDQQAYEYRYCDACQLAMGFSFLPSVPDPDLHRDHFDPMDEIKREDCP
jgi:hypothetical protein